MSLYARNGFAPRSRAVSLDTPPTTPHAYDDEFDGVALDAKWTRSAAPNSPPNDATAIDRYASFAAGGWRWSLNSLRKSWYMVQGDASSTRGMLYQAVTLPTDCFVWARFSLNFRYSVVAANDIRVGLALEANLAGVPDGNNRAYTYGNIPSAGNVIRAQGGRNQAAAAAITTTGNVGPQAAGTDSLCQPACYVAIQKIGTTYTSMLGYPNGNWIILAAQTYTGTALTWLVLEWMNTSSAAPGNMVVGFDFVRFFAGRYLP